MLNLKQSDTIKDATQTIYFPFENKAPTLMCVFRCNFQDSIFQNKIKFFVYSNRRTNQKYEACVPACVCSAGFVLDDHGNCVEPSSYNQCGPNSSWTDCGLDCTPTCQELNPLCSMTCVARCECDEDYVDYGTGNCILDIECPETTQAPAEETTTAVNSPNPVDDNEDNDSSNEDDSNNEDTNNDSKLGLFACFEILFIPSDLTDQLLKKKKFGSSKYAVKLQRHKRNKDGWTINKKDDIGLVQLYLHYYHYVNQRLVNKFSFT